MHTNITFANNASGNVYLEYVGAYNSLNELP